MLPVFVINLDRRPDRWAAISGNLSTLGIVPERIGATDADRVMGAIPDDLSLSPVACAYMIDREGAGIAIDEAPRVGMAVDSFLFDMIGSPAARRLKPAHTVPAMARVRPGQGSDICREFSPRATRPAMRTVFRAGVWLRRMAGQVRRAPVAHPPLPGPPD